MESASCPFCDLRVPSSEIQRHANSHFEDEQEQQQLAIDFELAQQLASSPSNFPHSPKNQVNCDFGSEETSGSVGEKANRLIHLQIKSEFRKIEGGLISLLRNCLESEPENTTSVLSGYVDHFESLESEDIGWGCGYRNVQMLSSHLLSQRREAMEALFSGSGFVPDISSLQRWLEIAWEKGFDEPGSEHFEKRIHGTKKWIGTTECAALFRSFGLRAMVVDFGPKESESLYLTVPGSSIGEKRKGVEVRGPMDRFVMRKSRGSTTEIGDSSGSRESKGRQILIDWIWNYFAGEKPINPSDRRRVIETGKAPLYFQHNGHSRTIVGIQVSHERKAKPLYKLLILDPAHKTAALERSLKQNVGWQKAIKRGVHTLKKPQYQLCYVDHGISNREELESLKTINSAFYEI